MNDDGLERVILFFLFCMDNGDNNSNNNNALRTFLEQPRSSKSAAFFYTAVCAAIVLSSAMMVLETLPQFYGHRRTHWFWAEAVIVTILTIEFILCIVAASWTGMRTLIRWLLSWTFFTEAISVLPFWLDVAFGGKRYADVQRLTVLRLFRLLRLVSIISSGGHLQRTLDALGSAICRCWDVLAAVFLLQFLLATMFATILYFCERGDWDSQGRRWLIHGVPSKFNSIPACYWYVYTVLSTVGLGDMTPQTALGRLISLPLMMSTVLLLTLPSIIIANHFAETWREQRSLL